MVPKDACILFPGFENVLPYVAEGTLQIRLRIWNWKDYYPGLPEGAQCSHSSEKWKKEVGEEDSE